MIDPAKSMFAQNHYSFDKKTDFLPKLNMADLDIRKSLNSPDIRKNNLAIQIWNAATLPAINLEKDPPVLPDPALQIEKALRSERASDALVIGHEILMASTDFFERVKQHSYQSFLSGLESDNKLQSLLRRIRETQVSLYRLRANPQPLAPLQGPLAPLVRMTRALLPSFDPHRALTDDFADARAGIKTSIETSFSVIKTYEDFFHARTETQQQIDHLVSCLDTAIDQIDRNDIGTDNNGVIAPDFLNSRHLLRDIFASIRSRADTTTQMMTGNRLIVQSRLDAEVVLASSLQDSTVAINVTMTALTGLLNKMTSASTPALRAYFNATVPEKLSDLVTSLNDIAAHIDQRQAAITNTTTQILLSPTKTVPAPAKS